MKYKLRLVLTVFLLVSSLVMSMAQDITEGREMFYDRLSDTYLCSVPESMFDDGSVDTYTSGEWGEKSGERRVVFTFLPILRLEGDFSNDYSVGRVSLIMPDGTVDSDMSAKVKWRGGTTNASGKHKRNYHLKFIGADGKKQDRKFFGLRNDNSWLLDAAQVDFSRVRNRVATDLWNDFATKPYYYDREKKALTGTRGQFVEVFLGDEYRGIYCMTEAMDRSQLKLKKYEETTDGTIIHGQLWKSGGYQNSMTWDVDDVYDDTAEAWGSTEVKYPDIEDVFPTDWSTYFNANQFVNNLMLVDDSKLEENGITREEANQSIELFRAEAGEYFDIPVLIDYYLFTILLHAIDNFNGKNIYWACYDKQESKMLTPAVWDLDCTVGGYFSAKQKHPEQFVGPKSYIGMTMKMLYALERYDVEGFQQKAIDRYFALRDNIFSAESLKLRYTSYMDMLSKSGAYDRDSVRWSGDSDLGGNILDYAVERDYICNWIDERLAFLDANIMHTLDQAFAREYPTLEIETVNLWQPITTEPVGAQIYATFNHGNAVIYDNNENLVQRFEDNANVYLLTLPEPFDLTNGEAGPHEQWYLWPHDGNSAGTKFYFFLDYAFMDVYTLSTEMPTAGIQNVVKMHSDSPRYNLMGIKVNDNYRGIIILDDKKKIVR